MPYPLVQRNATEQSGDSERRIGRHRTELAVEIVCCATRSPLPGQAPAEHRSEAPVVLDDEQPHSDSIGSPMNRS